MVGRDSITDKNGSHRVPALEGRSGRTTSDHVLTS